MIAQSDEESKVHSHMHNNTCINNTHINTCINTYCGLQGEGEYSLADFVASPHYAGCGAVLGGNDETTCSNCETRYSC